MVQAAYVGNEEHDAWAYLGRYDFAMSVNGLFSEYITLNDNTLADDAGNYVLADAIMLAPANETPPPFQYLYLSFAQDGYVGNAFYRDEDVLLFNASTGEWRIFFDGSDVGLSQRNLDAFAYRDGKLYFSLDASWGNYSHADVIQFTPTSLGENTSGVMSMSLAGAPDLTGDSENVDAISFNTQGRFLRSTTGRATVPPNLVFEDEDVFAHTFSGNPPYQMFLDGSAIGLNDNSEDINALWISSNGHVYLSTEGNFTVSGSSGDGADIVKCLPGQLTPCTFAPGLFWNGSAHGLGSPSATVDDFFVHNNQLLEDCETFGNGGFEAGFYCWEIIYPTPSPNLWRLSTVETHSGQFSAEARAETYTHTSDAFLISSPVQVSDDKAYRFRLWAKGIPEDVSGSMQVFGWLTWYVGDDVYQSDGFANISVQTHLAWTEFDSGFICPPSASVNRVRLEFELATQTLSQVGILGVGSIFIDDISWESQPCSPTAPQD